MLEPSTLELEFLALEPESTKVMSGYSTLGFRSLILKLVSVETEAKADDLDAGAPTH